MLNGIPALKHNIWCWYNIIYPSRCSQKLWMRLLCKYVDDSCLHKLICSHNLILIIIHNTNTLLGIKHFKSKAVQSFWNYCQSHVFFSSQNIFLMPYSVLGKCYFTTQRGGLTELNGKFRIFFKIFKDVERKIFFLKIYP